MLFLVVTALLIAMTTAVQPGQTDLSDHWSYQWYLDEPFIMLCNSSSLNVQSNERVTWETPNGMMLENNHDDKYFKLSEMNGVANIQLEVKKVREHLKGVYICRIYNSTTMRTKALVGLNLHDHKYHNMVDKYEYNIIVAVIATAVFVVPLLTTCVVYECRYQTDEQKEKHRLRRQKHDADPMEMKKPPGDNGVTSAETVDPAYVNPTFDHSTNL